MFIDKYNGFVFDLDGCLWENNKSIGKARVLLSTLREKEKKIVFLSNNSTRTMYEYKEKINDILDFQVREEEIVSSAKLAANYVSNKNYKKVFIIGEEGLKYFLEREKIEVYDSLDHTNMNLTDFDAVVVGMDRNFTYKKLDEAQDIILSGAAFIGTNIDPDFPQGKKVAPGGGAMIAALITTVGHEPEIIVGKPNEWAVNYTIEILNTSKKDTLIIGDRILTDVQAGINSGIDSALVLTGRGKFDLEKFGKNIKPTYIFSSINDLLD